MIIDRGFAEWNPFLNGGGASTGGEDTLRKIKSSESRTSASTIRDMDSIGENLAENLALPSMLVF